MPLCFSGIKMYLISNVATSYILYSFYAPSETLTSFTQEDEKWVDRIPRPHFHHCIEEASIHKVEV